MKRNIYRHATNKRLGGVCAGIAEYFGLETWLVRILTVTALFFIGPFILFLYVMGWFVLDKGTGPTLRGNSSGHQGSVDERVRAGQFDDSYRQHGYAGKGWINNGPQHDQVKVKSTIWSAGLPPKQAITKLSEQFDQYEHRLRRVEAYVTSTRFRFEKEMRDW